MVLAGCHYMCTGLPLSSFAEVQACVAGQAQQLPGGLALQPLKSRHAEACYGLLVHWQGTPVLGWTVRLVGCCYAAAVSSHVPSTRDLRQGVRVVSGNFVCEPTQVSCCCVLLLCSHVCRLTLGTMKGCTVSWQQHRWYCWTDVPGPALSTLALTSYTQQVGLVLCTHCLGWDELQ